MDVFDYENFAKRTILKKLCACMGMNDERGDRFIRLKYLLDCMLESRESSGDNRSIFLNEINLQITRVAMAMNRDD